MRKTVKVLLAVTLAVLMVCTLVACGETDTQQSGNDVNYTISFETNGGSQVAKMVVDGKSEITIPQTTKEGYFFAGWFVDNNTFQIPFDLDYIKANPNNTAITLYAKWLDAFDVTFEANGGSAVATQKVADGRFANQPPVPTKAGFVFDGWYKEASFVTAFNFRTDKITDNTTIYAKWVAVDSFLIFTFTDSSNSAYSVKQKSGATLPDSIDLPAEYNGKPVVAIGSQAFYGCRSLTSVTIPEGVTSIGERAFEDCSSLTSVTFEAGSKLTSIGESAFWSCSSLTSVTIPSSVKIIRWQAFRGCSSLTSVTIPSSVTRIDSDAFSGCSSLTIYAEAASKPSMWNKSWNYYPVVWDSVNNNIASDGNIYAVLEGIRYALKDGNATVVGQPSTITTANIPASVTFNNLTYNVTSIGVQAFDGCSRLTSVTIPASVTNIGWSAFSGCLSLTSVTIPAGVTSIGWHAFSGCSSLAIYAEAPNKPAGWDSDWNYSSCPVVWDSVNNSLASDGNIYAVLEGIRYALKDGKATVVRQSSAITTANILASVTFNNLTYNVTSIDQDAFSECRSLTSVTIPSGVTRIDDYAFMYCSSLTSVTIPSSVTSIGAHAFSECSSLTSVTIPAGVTSIGDYAFEGCSSLTSVTIPSGVTSIGNDAFSRCSSLTSVTFEAGSKLSSIGNDAFSRCSSLTSVTIPSSVTSIGNDAFSRCSGLTRVTIPDSVTSIGVWAFYGCSGLTSVTIPSSVTSIGYRAFDGCSSLTSVTIPSSVTSIGERAFNGCDELNKINCEVASKPSGWNSGWNDGCFATVVWGYTGA